MRSPIPGFYYLITIYSIHGEVSKSPRLVTIELFPSGKKKVSSRSQPKQKMACINEHGGKNECAISRGVERSISPTVGDLKDFTAYALCGL